MCKMIVVWSGTKQKKKTMSNTIYALYYVVYNSGNECHDLQEPCYYDKAEAERALTEAQKLAGDPWSGVMAVYLEEINIV